MPGAGLGTGEVGLVGHAATRVARREKAATAGQDRLVFLEVFQKFTTEKKKKARKTFTEQKEDKNSKM